MLTLGASVLALIKSDLRRHNINTGLKDGDIKAVSNKHIYAVLGMHSR